MEGDTFKYVSVKVSANESVYEFDTRTDCEFLKIYVHDDNSIAIVSTLWGIPKLKRVSESGEVLELKLMYESDPFKEECVTLEKVPDVLKTSLLLWQENNPQAQLRL